MGQELTDEEFKALQNQFLKSPAPVAKPAAPKAGKQPAVLDEVRRGLGRGLVSGPSSVVDLVGLGLQSGLEAAGLDPKFRLPSATEGAENLGLPKVSTPVGRIAEGVSGGAALTPFAPMIGGAAGGVGATAIELAKQFTDDPVILAGAGLAGGLSTNSLAKSVKAGAKVIGSLQPTIRRRILQGQMERLLAGHVPDVPDAIARANEANKLAQRIPGFQPSLAEVVPSAQQASRILRQSDPAIAATQNKRLNKNIETLVTAAEKQAKRLPSGTAESARQALRHRKQNLDAVHENMVAKVHTDFDEALRPIREEVGDIPDAAGFGEQVRTTVKQAFEAEKSAFDERFAALELNMQVDPSISVRALEALEQGAKQAERKDLPDLFTRDVIRNFGQPRVDGAPFKGTRGPRGTEALGEIRAVRSSLLSERMAEKAKLAPDRNKIRLISQLLDGVEQNIEEAIGASQSLALKQLNDDYRQFKLRFSAGPIDDVLASSRPGGDKKSDIDLFNIFTSNIGGKGIERFQALQGVVGDAQARALFGQALMSKMMKQARKPDGTFDPKQIERFVAGNEEVLRELPGIQRQMIEASRAARAVVKVPTRPPTLEDFDNTFTRTLMGEDPSRAMKKLVDSGNMEEGLRFMSAAFGSEPASFRAISRPMWKALLDKSGVTPSSETTFAALQHESMGRLLQRNKDALKKFYGDEAFDGLVDIQKAARINAESPIGLSAQMSAPKSNFSGLLKTLWSRAFGIARGVIGPQFTTAEAFSRRVANLVDAFDEKEIRIIMDNLLHDQNLIGTLTKVETIQDTLKAQRGLKRWLRLNVAPAVGAVAQEVAPLVVPIAQEATR